MSNGRSTLCEFHAPVDEKTLTVDAFNQEIARLIDTIRSDPNQAEFNFKGFVFPGNIAFTGTYPHSVNFAGALFAGSVSFWMVRFEKYAGFEGVRFIGDADFKKTHFLDPDWCAYFQRATFEGEVDFWEARFAAGTSFSDAIFRGGKSNFTYATFASGSIYFSDTSLLSAKVDFSYTTFIGDLQFLNTEFGEGVTLFSHTRFSDVFFLSCRIGGTLTFTDTLIEGRNTFMLDNPYFVEATATVNFDRVVFSPSRTFFSNVPDGIWYAAHERELRDLRTSPSWPIIRFRFCQLTDVHFSSCFMGLFSFLTSSFSQARFNDCTWLQDKEHVLYSFAYRRMNMMIEEVWYELRRKLPEGDKGRKRIEALSAELRGPHQIAEMYRQMKAALDGSQEYAQSGYFYFNECEMRRLAYREAFHPIRYQRSKRSKIWGRFLLIPALLKPRHHHVSLRWLAYSIYYRIAGYGERPMFAFGWFIFFTIFFAAMHMLHGYRYLKSDVVNYDIDLTLRGLGNMIDLSFLGKLLGSLGGAIALTLYRIIPGGYLPKEMSEHSPYNVESPFQDPWGLILLVANSAVLLLLIAFIVAGMQRHFKRA